MDYSVKSFTARVIVGLALMFIMVGVISICFGNSNPAEIDVRYQRGKLSANLHKADFKKVLEEVAQKSSISITVDPDLLKKIRTVTLSFENLSLDEGLKRIIAPNSWAMVFGGSPLQLVDLKVVPSTSGNSTQIRNIINKRPIATRKKIIWTEENIKDEKMWSSQPMLSEIVSYDNIAEDLKRKANLSDEQLLEIKRLAQVAIESYRSLDYEYRKITNDIELGKKQERERMSAKEYNGRVFEIVNTGDDNIRDILTRDQYEEYIGWLEQRYAEMERIADEYRTKPPPDLRGVPIVDLPPLTQGENHD